MATDYHPAGASDVPRLHWGCGSVVPDNWINSDIMCLPGVDLCCDIREGLPLRSESIDYITSQHALQQLKIEEIVYALEELHRVLRKRGVLRLCLPDFDQAVVAYQMRDPDSQWCWDWKSPTGNFISQIIDCNSTRTPLTSEWTKELLDYAGFDTISRVGYRETPSDHKAITSLDNRPDESFYLEAVK